MEKADLLEMMKQLSSRELKELCKEHGLKGFSGLKHDALAKFACENLPLPEEELKQTVCCLLEDKLLCKVRDAGDYFLTKRVEINYVDEELAKGSVGGYSVTINNLGSENFSYICDEKCQDFLYQVRKGRYPYCKHYPALVAELVLKGFLDPAKTRINFIEGRVLEELLSLVEQRRREEEIALEVSGRTIEDDLLMLQEDYLEISRQNQSLARSKYHDTAENVFEMMTDRAFQLLDFDNIRRRKTQGWDLILIAGRATPPYIAVAECKTAAGGVYSHVFKDEDYLVRLRSYCIEMVKNKLVGAYRDYVKYCLVVAPSFDPRVEELAPKFRRLAEGIRLSFWPAEVILDLVVRYRENPIILQTVLEDCFAKERIITREDIDEAFRRSEAEIDALTERARRKLRQRFEQFSQIAADTCFIKLDTMIMQSMINDVIEILEPELLVKGKIGALGVETIYLKHDYWAIWDRITRGLQEEYTQLLREESFFQTKRTEFKDEILKFLGI
jgi:hypothetical protein